MNRHIVFFINPVSGTKNKKKLEEGIIDRCVREGVAFQILFTSAEGNYSYLISKIEEEYITDIVICSGDGSLRAIIATLLNINIAFGIIPSGSGNGLARSAGIPQSLEGALDVIFKGTARAVDGILINEQFSCHLSGLGFDAQVAHDFAKQKTRGLKTYILQVIKNFFAIRSYSFEIVAEGKQFKEEAICICITNSNQFGNNFKIAPMASICDGLMDVIIFRKNTKTFTILSVMQQVFSGKISKLNEKHMQKKRVLYFQTTNLKIYNLQGAAFHIDGDPVKTKREFSIKILPGAYKLLQN